MGYAACEAASDTPVAEGNVGAGTGATLGKMLGPACAMKSGLGSAAISIGSGLVVGALVVVNAIGDILDPSTGAILAGVRKPGSDEFADSLQVMKSMLGKKEPHSARSVSSTVIGVVATNARLTKEEANKMAQMGQNGVARSVRPAHMMLDGDTLFALSTGRDRADVNLIGAYAAEMVAEAVVRAVKAAEGIPGIPAWRDLQSKQWQSASRYTTRS
jgi:L-aminopeptidase/D-esterase-like protein